MESVWTYWHPIHPPDNEWRITLHVHHCANICLYYRPTAVQAKRQYLLTLQVSRYRLLPLKSIVIQKILDKSGRTCWMTWKSHSTPPDYSGNMHRILSLKKWTTINCPNIGLCPSFIILKMVVALVHIGGIWFHIL